jgi:hypothetical protein
VRQHREQVTPVAGHLGQEPGLAAAAQQVPDQRDRQQFGVAAGGFGAGPGRAGMAMARAVIKSWIST